ncbi:MAG: ABC-2 family transporter protein [Bdellovibrionales bacterium]|nr:ABC-2 family transporter protein [Bdellovibrionales bacterium]
MSRPSLFGVYGSFVRNAFLKMLAYRMRYYTGIFTYLLFVAVYYFIWEAIFAGKPQGARVNGYTLPEMLTYITIGWIARSTYFSNIDHEIDDLVETGQISVFLTRPVNFQLMMFSQAIGESIFRAIFFSVPISLVVLNVFPVQAPANFAALLLFLCASGLGFFMMAALNFVVGLLAFYIKSIEGIMRAKYNLVNLASGLLLPLTFFPEWLRVILEALPFQALAYVPLNFYLGKVSGPEALPILLNQVYWLSGLTLLGYLMWSRAAAKLTLQGG